MATIAVQQVTLAGITPALVAASGGGDKTTPGDTTWLYVLNGGGSPITVTITATVASNTGRLNNEGGSVAAGAIGIFGPLKASRFAAASDGTVGISYSGVTSVTVGVFSI